MMILLLPENDEYLDPPGTEKRQNCLYFYCWVACRGSWADRPGSQAPSLAVSPRLQQLPRGPWHPQLHLPTVARAPGLLDKQPC